MKRVLWRFCSCCCAPYCEKVEVVDYYTTEVETLTLQIKELKETSLKAPLGKQYLYVTYLPSLHMDIVFNDMRSRICTLGEFG
jgi:hypothetical protein